MNVGYVVQRAARWYSDNVAFICGDQRPTYRQMDERANKTGNTLLGLGLRKGERVAALLQNSVECVEVDFGTAKAGLVRVPLNARTSADELTYIVDDSEASALIFGQEFQDLVSSARPRLPSVTHYVCLGGQDPRWLDYQSLVSGAPTAEPPIHVDDEDLYALRYTSGTTGKPKGVMLTHRNWFSGARDLLLDAHPITHRDKMLHVAPLSHASAIYVLAVYMRGGSQVILWEFDPQKVLDTIQSERVTLCMFVPTMLVRLLAYPDLKKYDLSSLQTITYGAAPMPADKLKEAMRVFGLGILEQGYGLTEVPLRITQLTKEDHMLKGTKAQLRRLASAGRELTAMRVRVVDEQGRDVQAGQVGEVIARGDNVMKGYWRLPEATAEKLKDGWFYTSDLATVDEQGYIFLVDRKSEMIITGGFNVYPLEVENVIHEHPAVLEVAVIGVPSEEWGEEIKAVVVRRDGRQATEEEIIEHCRQRLPSYKKPRSVAFVQSLPKSPVGKILRRSVREEYWRGYDRLVR